LTRLTRPNIVDMLVMKDNKEYERAHSVCL